MSWRSLEKTNNRHLADTNRYKTTCYDSKSLVATSDLGHFKITYISETLNKKPFDDTVAPRQNTSIHAPAGVAKGQKNMQALLNNKGIARLLEDIAEKIYETISKKEDTPPAIVGIRSRGELLAERLKKILEKKFGKDIDRGTLDITLYRDDLNQMGYEQPVVRATEIEFDIDDRIIILVDDVLKTGRTVRAALDAIIDLGRPKVIKLAVLIDRGQRELPISPDYVGKRIEAPKDKKIMVRLKEVDKLEDVTLE